MINNICPKKNTSEITPEDIPGQFWMLHFSVSVSFPLIQFESSTSQLRLLLRTPIPQLTLHGDQLLHTGTGGIIRLSKKVYQFSFLGKGRTWGNGAKLSFFFATSFLFIKLLFYFCTTQEQSKGF